MSGRGIWIGALGGTVLIIAVLNMQGSQNQSVHASEDPAAQAELLLLRERVATLERKLNARLLKQSGDAFTLPPPDDAAAPTPVSGEELDVHRRKKEKRKAERIAAEAEDAAKRAEAAAAAAPVPVEAADVPGVSGHIAAPLPERKAPPVPAGVVPMGSWWSDKEVKMANGEWCPKPAPYSALKPPLPQLTPPDEKPFLTKELAKKHASSDNLLIATYVNYNRLDFAYTFVKHLLALRNPHFLVGALDVKALRGLQTNGIPSFIMSGSDGTGLTTSDYGWGTKAFRELGLHKVQLVLNLAKTGVDCITVDADAFILRDPFPYIRARPTADVLMSSDHLVATNGYEDTGLEGLGGFYSAFNIGYIYIKANAVEFVEAWRDMCFKRKNDWDQVLFGQVLQMDSEHTVDKNRLRKMYKKSDGTHVMAGVLPVALFASGHTFFVSRMAHLMHEHPYMVHTTFQYGGAQGKRHRLRESMMWEDDHEYYTGQFLVYEPDLPYKMVYPNGGKVGPDGTQDFKLRGSVEQHFALVHHQLTQMRNAFALAKELGRILILPRLVCGLDRWWAPHQGIIPGSAARLPLLECPADHVIDLERIGKPELVLRESSMLCNPRTPAAVLSSQRNVSVAGVPRVAADGSDAAAAREVGQQLVAQLKADHGSAKVLRLRTPPPDYRALLPANKVDAFENVMRGYSSLWCCSNPPGGRGAGHIWYDFLWDVLPHRDRFGRTFDTKNPWYPKMGP